ncbi:unnamed protein product [Rhizopus microsporus]
MERAELGSLQGRRRNSDRGRQTFCTSGSSIQVAFLVMQSSCCGSNKVHIIVVIGRGRSKSNVDREYQVRGKSTQEVRYQHMGASNTRPDAQGMEAIKKLFNGFFMFLETQRMQFLIGFYLVVLNTWAISLDKSGFEFIHFNFAATKLN